MEPVEEGRTHVLVLTSGNFNNDLESTIVDLLGDGTQVFWFDPSEASDFLERNRKRDITYSGTFDVFVFLTKIDFQEEFFKLLKAPDAFVLDLK